MVLIKFIIAGLNNPIININAKVKTCVAIYNAKLIIIDLLILFLLYLCPKIIPTNPIKITNKTSKRNTKETNSNKFTTVVLYVLAAIDSVDFITYKLASE